MENLEHLEIVKQGVDVWNKWRNYNPGIERDLSKDNLEGAHLETAHGERRISEDHNNE